MTTEPATHERNEPTQQTERGRLTPIVLVSVVWTVVLCAIGGFFAAFLFYAPGASHDGLEWPGLALLLAVVIANAAVVTFVFRRRRLLGVGFGAVLAGLTIFATYTGANYSVKARCGAWSLKASIGLRSMAQIMIDRSTDGERLPPSMAVHLIELSPDWIDFFGSPCGSCRLKMVRIGQYTLADLEADRVTIDELKAEAEAVAAREPGRWERMGTYWISHDQAIWQAFDGQVIGGFMLEQNVGSRSRVISRVFSDGHVESLHLGPTSDVNDREDLDYLKSNLAATIRRSLPLPPKELFDYMGLDMSELLQESQPQ